MGSTHRLGQWARQVRVVLVAAASLVTVFVVASSAVAAPAGQRAVAAGVCTPGAGSGPVSTSVNNQGTTYEVVYRGAGAANGCLVTADQSGHATVHHLGLAAGSDPAVTPVIGSARFEVAFQANTGHLWTSGPDGNRDRHLGMAANTSPAMAPDVSVAGGWEAAFQANTGRLWMTGTAGTRALPWAMMAGTSPSIVEMIGGGFRIAFQATTGHLWVTDDIPRATAVTVQAHDLGLGMAAGTSPSIIDVSNGGPAHEYQVAFQANTGIMWSIGQQGRFAHNYDMAAGTSPQIYGNSAGYVVALQTNVQSTYLVGPDRDIQKYAGPDQAGSSPSVTPVRDRTGTWGLEVTHTLRNTVRADGSYTWTYPLQ